MQSYALIAFVLSAGVVSAQIAGPSFGEVVSLGATPSDMVIDEGRKQLYLVNSAANRLDIYNYETNSMAGSIQVGTYPLSAAMSMDGAYLYVTNTQSSSLSVISLSNNVLTETVSLPARPEGVAVGADGRVLITTQGTGTNNLLNTLLLFDRGQSWGQQVTSVPSPPQITTPAPLPAVFVGRPATAFPGRLIRTPDGQFIIGMVAINQTTNGANTALFIYETASGIVLKNRSVTGQSTVLAISPDASRFMAGSTLYDTATLAVVAQMNTANLPFFIGAGTNPNFNVQFNYGGSLFSPDGATLYSAFNTANNGLRPVANVLYIGSPTNLGVRLGIKLPQTILGKMVGTSNGEHIFATSESGIIHFPLATLYEHPILQPETTQVFLAIDNCNKGVSKAEVKVSNLGQGKLTFSVPTVTSALVTQAASGLVPSTIEFILEPGRSGVVRQPGTNLWAGTTGTPINVTLQSTEAINIPNTVRVYMNYRQPDQRGIIYPRPVSLNNGQGLQELLLDEPRQRVYISNSGFNRIEIFDMQRQRFLEPLDVGQLPRSMAMSLDGSLLYVGNTGGESISVVDLDTLTVGSPVNFPPIPRAGNQNSIQPVALAMGLSGLQFMMSNGTFWRLVGNDATPRLANSITPASIGSPQYMMSTPGGEYILVLGTVTNQTMGYLYDALLDTYLTSRQLYDQTPVSYFGPMTAAPGASFYVVGGMTLSSSLALIGGVERPGLTQTTPGQQPGQQPTQTTVSAGQRNVASVYAIDENRFVRLTTPVRQNSNTTPRDEARSTFEMVDVRTGAESMVGIAPENPVNNVFGSTRVNVPPRQLAVDSKGTAYMITLSGLSVVQLTTSGTSPRPTVTDGARGVVNSTDGTPNFRPGSFITINGANLATPASADTVPLPTVLGGTCVTFNDVAIPLIQASSGQISAVIPPEIRSGQNVMQVRSLASAQASDPIVVTVQRPQN